MPPIQIERMEWHFSGLAAKEMAQTAPNREPLVYKAVLLDSRQITYRYTNDCQMRVALSQLEDHRELV